MNGGGVWLSKMQDRVLLSKMAIFGYCLANCRSMYCRVPDFVVGILHGILRLEFDPVPGSTYPEPRGGI